MLLSLIKVRGHSMEPYLQEGSFFIASDLIYKFRKPKVGDIILFEFDKKIIVKRIYKIDMANFLIEGINKNDSKVFDSLNREQILAKLIIKL